MAGGAADGGAVGHFRLTERFDAANGATGARARAAPSVRPGYLVQCIAGLQELVAEELLRAIPDATVSLIEEGFVACASAADVAAVRALPFVSNAFAVIDEVEGSDTDLIVRDFSRQRGWWRAARAAVERPDRRFRVMVSDEGRLVGGGRATTAFVDALAHATRLTPSRMADTEFWVIRRRSGRAFLAKRLTRRAGTEKTLAKGALRPQLAHLMCLLSEPAAADVVLDPFAGSGALPLARLALPYNMIFALDADRAAAAALRQAMKEGRVRPRKDAPLIAGVADARALARFEDGFVHKVITDPPWGLFDDAIADLPGFYRAVLAELARVLRADGVLVMLLGQKALADELVAGFAALLRLERRFEILVNGRPASLLKWRRTATPAPPP